MLLSHLTAHSLPAFAAPVGLILNLIIYAGPETVLPLASGLAALIGFLLIVWQRFMTILSRTLGFCRRKLAAHGLKRP